MKRFSIQVKGPHLLALFSDGSPHTVQASQALPDDAILESVTQDIDQQGATFCFRSDGSVADAKFDQFVRFPVELTLVPSKIDDAGQPISEVVKDDLSHVASEVVADAVKDLAPEAAKVIDEAIAKITS